MIQTTEKVDINRKGGFQSHSYNNDDINQPSKLEKPPFSFLRDSTSLLYFCLTDKRFRQIFGISFKLIKQIKKNKHNSPAYVKDAFIELGSTFIKIGQFLSSRTDLLPKEYIEALSELQDSLPPLSFEDIKKTIESELRKPIESIFTSINPEPIASASIGQVHRAELLNGIQVIVKAQRPDLSALFEKDLFILRYLAVYFEKYTEIGKGREWIQIVDEMKKTLFEEIDFIQEGKNADKLRKNLRYEDQVYIPRIFWRGTTKKIIVIEYASGIKITDVDTLRQKNLNPKDIAVRLVNAYFKQFFEDGFYHADPHPGNIVVRDDGTIVFYDFGMVGRLNETVRNELAQVLLSIVKNDTDTLLTSLQSLKLIKPGTDIKPVKKIINQAVYDYYDGGKLNNLNLDGLESDIKKIVDEKPFILPGRFTYALRMTGTLEGICRTLDPDFSLINIAKPYLQNWMKEHLIESESKWSYLKSLFPEQNKLINKIKIYSEVIKDIPKYVSNLEHPVVEVASCSVPDESQDIIANLKIEIKENNSKLKAAYLVIFLLCFTLFGVNLIQNGNYVINILGFFLLSSSLAGSIGLIWWSIINNRKMLE